MTATKDRASSVDDTKNATSDRNQVSNNKTKVEDSMEEKKDVNSKLFDADTDEESVTLGIDGGYGWVIVAASFLSSVIVDGVCFSFGIFLMEFLDYYGGSKANVAWVGSVLNGTYLTIGPIVSALSNKFSCRVLAIAGSILAAVSFILSTFSPNVEILILTYGAMASFGFGFMYLPAIVMVGFYFDKKRAFATGIAVCGSGIGAFMFAPLCRYLIDTYAWQGATWILAGICLQGVVMGCLYRPLVSAKPKKLTEKGIMERTSEHKRRNLSECEDSTPTVKLLQKESNAQCIHSMQNLTSSSPSSHLKKNNLAKSYDDLLVKNGGSAKAHDLRVAALTKPLARKDIFYTGSVEHLPEYKKAGGNIEEYLKNVTVSPEGDQGDAYDDGQPSSKNIFTSITETLQRVLGISLLKNPVFLVYGLSCFLCMTGFFVPFIFLPDHAYQMGLSKQQGAFLISIIGIANTVARVVCGFISDLPWVDCLMFNNVALIVAGVTTMLCPYCFNYGLLASYSAVFGVGIAVFVSLRSIIVVELLGLDNLTGAFGLVTMFQGLSTFIGAPIAGALFDATGDYSYSFYLAGGTLALSGVICLPLRRLSNYLKRKEGTSLVN